MSLDPSSPIPLYHQLAETIRYRIATGALKPGDPLPPLRRAAAIWKVNLHTVRRAYSELSKSGVVETRAPRGTCVASTVPKSSRSASQVDRERHLRILVDEARDVMRRFGISQDELFRELRRSESQSPKRDVYVIECSATQCDDLAAQIEARFSVKAHGWPIDRRKALPPGAVIATYFHYNEVRRRWPKRLSDVRFLAIAPEPDLASRFVTTTPGGRARSKVILCERDESMARNIAADLVRMLPSADDALTIRIVERAKDCLRGASERARILVSPRLFGELPANLREDPRITQVRYVFDPAALDALGDEQRWERT